MKVLLLHEMSGVHTELRKGLRYHGIEADIATLDTSFRKYETDIFLGSNKDSLYGNISRVANQLLLIPKLKKYDIIQVLSQNPFHKVIARLMENLVYSGKKTVYIAAGSDAIYRQFVQDLDYYPPHDEFKNNKKFAQLSNKLKTFSNIVPVCWEYEYAMKCAGFHTEDVVPFPISIGKQKVKNNNNNKLKVFHPQNRSLLHYDFKGTLLIQEAFHILKKKYSDVEFIIKGKMSHKEYDLFTDEMDIIVDQCYSYTYGMSAAYGLAKGKVVLSGLEEIAKKGHYKECPIINIKPDVSDIVEKLSYLIENRKEINVISEASRSFAEKYHDYKKVAEKYIKIYTK